MWWIPLRMFWAVLTDRAYLSLLGCIESGQRWWMLTEMRQAMGAYAVGGAEKEDPLCVNSLPGLSPGARPLASLPRGVAMPRAADRPSPARSSGGSEARPFKY